MIFTDLEAAKMVDTAFDAGCQSVLVAVIDVRSKYYDSLTQLDGLSVIDIVISEVRELIAKLREPGGHL